MPDKLAGGANIEWVPDAYPRIKKEDIPEPLRYAKAVLSNEEIIEAIHA